MTDILNTHITNIPGLSFECNCGKKHSIDIKSIFIQKNAISKIGDIVRQFPEGKIFLLSVCSKLHVQNTLQKTWA